MTVKINGLKPAQRRLNNLKFGFDMALDHSMERLLKDIVNQAMENLRNNVKGETFSHGEKERVPLNDNFDNWHSEKIGINQWRLWNDCPHAAPVEHGSRTPITPTHGDWLHLGRGILKKEVRGQNPKHFFGDALYYQRDRWTNNLSKYMRSRINELTR